MVAPIIYVGLVEIRPFILECPLEISRGSWSGVLSVVLVQCSYSATGNLRTCSLCHLWDNIMYSPTTTQKMPANVVLYGSICEGMVYRAC